MTEKAFQKIKAGLEDARDMLAAAPVAAAPYKKEKVPEVTARFVTSDGKLTGSQLVPVRAVRVSDDGSQIDVDLDYWPSTTAPVAVKALVWEPHPAGLVASAGGIGDAYIIDTRIARRVHFMKGMDHNRIYPSLEAAKAAAQADYERRVRACLVDAQV